MHILAFCSAKLLCDHMHVVQALPFMIETPSQRKRRDGLEAKLLEVEEALELFNQPQVLVAV